MANRLIFYRFIQRDAYLNVAKSVKRQDLSEMSMNYFYLAELCNTIHTILSIYAIRTRRKHKTKTAQKPISLNQGKNLVEFEVHEPIRR